MVTIGEKKVFWEEGMTVATLLSKLKDGGDYAVVKLDGRLVSRPHFNDTPVPDDAQVMLIPMIAGG